MATPDGPFGDVDAALAFWRQGDCVLGEQRFVFQADPERPLTQESREGTADGAEFVDTGTPGLCVLTQTCDLVRASGARPFVEVAPLTEVSEESWRAASRGRLPRFAVIPGLAEQRLVADLDRVMTVEKGVVANWRRVAGCTTDGEVRAFAYCLARKRVRFAFPDDFVAFVRPLQDRLIDKHEKGSDEGRALRSLAEIRVRAAPAWDALEIELTFYFLRGAATPTFEGKAWHALLEAWLGRLPKNGRFANHVGSVLTLDDLTAREYVESDPLDLGYLSSRSG